MELKFTSSFDRDYRSLPKLIQKALDKKLLVFLADPHYRSLRVKKMGGYDNVWEARINKNYRFTFSIGVDVYIIRRAGNHSILNRP